MYQKILVANDGSPLDYQFINHPAYNRDRGPVAIFGLRTRVQF